MILYIYIYIYIYIYLKVENELSFDKSNAHSTSDKMDYVEILFHVICFILALQMVTDVIGSRFLDVPQPFFCSYFSLEFTMLSITAEVL